LKPLEIAYRGKQYASIERIRQKIDRIVQSIYLGTSYAEIAAIYAVKKPGGNNHATIFTLEQGF
jgi:hypothetical protein